MVPVVTSPDLEDITSFATKITETHIHSWPVFFLLCFLSRLYL